MSLMTENLALSSSIWSDIRRSASFTTCIIVFLSLVANDNAAESLLFSCNDAS